MPVLGGRYPPVVLENAEVQLICSWHVSDGNFLLEKQENGPSLELNKSL